MPAAASRCPPPEPLLFLQAAKRARLGKDQGKAKTVLEYDHSNVLKNDGNTGSAAASFSLASFVCFSLPLTRARRVVGGRRLRASVDGGARSSVRRVAANEARRRRKSMFSQSQHRTNQHKFRSLRATFTGGCARRASVSTLRNLLGVEERPDQPHAKPSE
jgi:hypothetical protein